MSDCCATPNLRVNKEKVSVAYVDCRVCGTTGPTVRAETHDEAESKAVEAWEKVRDTETSGVDG